MIYSKRHIKDLPSPKEIVVKSLSDYIELFSSEKFTNFIYRGEPTNFEDTISSAFRGKKHHFIQMKNEFKREIYHRLTEDERKDFLAFAQHYGIPTNLIDFTRSPLVALFFACQPFQSKNESFDKTRGFVYLLRNDLIDITELLYSREDDNFLKRFIQGEDGIVLTLYGKFVDFEKRYPETFYYYFKTLNADWKYYFVDMQPITPKKYRFPKYNNGEYKWKIKHKFITDHSDILREIERKNGMACFEVLEYTLMLQEYLRRILINKEMVWWLNCMPNFLYSPYLSFERGRNQQGLFVYQAYLSFDEELSDAHILSQQRVWPDYVIVVENKDEILQKLDFLGINEKFIYGDYDRIARYIIAIQKNKQTIDRHGKMII